MDPRAVEKLIKAREMHLTTKGRRTGRPHEVEVWYAYSNGKIYTAASLGHKADWIKNIASNNEVSVRIADTRFKGKAVILEGEASSIEAIRLCYTKYYGQASDDVVKDWYEDCIPIRIDLTE